VVEPAGGGEWTQPRDQRRYGEWPGVRNASASAVDSHLAAGDRRFDAGDFHGAIDAYSQALNVDPELAYAYCNRGSARRRLQDSNGAILDLSQAIRLNPDYALAFNNRGYARLKQRDPEGAVADFDKAIELGDTGSGSYQLSMTYRNRAKAHRELNNDEQAAKDDATAERLGFKKNRRVR
jgi:tetratricopeptide (TPR) repeat protein